MIIENKYEMGQTVYRPEVTHKEWAIDPCRDCLGSRTWECHLPNGEVVYIDCPTCKRGYESTGTELEYKVTGGVRVLTVGKIRYDNGSIDYMCEQTGIGTGWVHPEKDLFPTQAEAEAVLPGMIEAKKIFLEESRATSRKRKIKDDAGRMAAYYRAQIRDAHKQIAEARRGLDREKCTHSKIPLARQLPSEVEYGNKEVPKL